MNGANDVRSLARGAVFRSASVWCS